MRERFKGRPHTGKKRGTLVAALTFYQENESRPLGEYMYGPQYLEIREQNRLRLLLCITFALFEITCCAQAGNDYQLLRGFHPFSAFPNLIGRIRLFGGSSGRGEDPLSIYYQIILILQVLAVEANLLQF
ncbi:uncharacterized protein LOC113310419 isoform X2 [Papaver somniferum]|uniref:uncharacterized protein LOC113310419 isoform X2 n=1 Tax=Papaver somniferum TaxID=3469 RepID=UPI000E6FECB8|nr:uncharacterized protein LOC113310419 isoform X2 [Papaver somniferum]